MSPEHEPTPASAPTICFMSMRKRYYCPNLAHCRSRPFLLVQPGPQDLLEGRQGLRPVADGIFDRRPQFGQRLRAPSAPGIRHHIQLLVASPEVLWVSSLSSWRWSCHVPVMPRGAGGRILLSWWVASGLLSSCTRAGTCLWLLLLTSRGLLATPPVSSCRHCWARCGPGARARRPRSGPRTRLHHPGGPVNLGLPYRATMASG